MLRFQTIFFKPVLSRDTRHETHAWLTSGQIYGFSHSLLEQQCIQRFQFSRQRCKKQDWRRPFYPSELTPLSQRSNTQLHCGPWLATFIYVKSNRTKPLPNGRNFYYGLMFFETAVGLFLISRWTFFIRSFSQRIHHYVGFVKNRKKKKKEKKETLRYFFFLFRFRTYKISKDFWEQLSVSLRTNINFELFNVFSDLIFNNLSLII